MSIFVEGENERKKKLFFSLKKIREKEKKNIFCFIFTSQQ